MDMVSSHVILEDETTVQIHTDTHDSANGSDTLDTHITSWSQTLKSCPQTRETGTGGDESLKVYVCVTRQLTALAGLEARYEARYE